jgi:hypothetical protein
MVFYTFFKRTNIKKILKYAIFDFLILILALCPLQAAIV